MSRVITPLSESAYFKNPGYLKLDLMLRGVRVDPSVFEGPVLKKYELSPGTFGNLDLVLPKETYVSVPYQEPDAADSPYRLRLLRGKYFLTSSQGNIEVKIIPHPSFYREPVSAKATLGEVAACHAGYVSLALGGHRYLQPNLGNLKNGPFRPHLVLTPDEIVSVLERIKKSQAIDVITLSAWEAGGEDGGIQQIEPYIRIIKKTLNVLLFVEVHLPRTTAWIDRTYAMGADSVCYHLGNLCHHGGPEIQTGPAEDEAIQFFTHAVSVFPPGSILSHITMGNRPFEEVMEDIERLTRIKVLPILTVTRREEVLAQGLATAQLAPLFGYVYNAANRNKITMNWFSRLAPFIAPIEGRFFSGDVPRLKLALLNFYQSRFFGGSVSAGLSNLRRKLRVREVRRGKN